MPAITSALDNYAHYRLLVRLGRCMLPSSSSSTFDRSPDLHGGGDDPAKLRGTVMRSKSNNLIIFNPLLTLHLTTGTKPRS